MARDFGRRIDNIILHCTATTQQATVEQILNYWKNTLGWKSPGYHYMIDPLGKTTVIAELSEITNGVRGYNWNSVHIAYIGGKDGKDDRTAAQKKEMERIIRNLLSDDYLGPNTNIFGHRDLSPDLNNDGIISPNEWTKLCPGFDVKTWLKEIKI